METILDVLKAMEKATAREIAARMKIEPAAVIGMLREHEERNEVAQTNGYWKVATGKVKSQPKAISSVSKAPATVSVSDVIALLAEHGPQTSLELATLAGIESKRVAPMLTHHMTKGGSSAKSWQQVCLFGVGHCVSENKALHHGNRRHQLHQYRKNLSLKLSRKFPLSSAVLMIC